MRTLQPWQVWLTFKDWVEKNDPPFAFSVARYLIAGSQIAPADRQWAALTRQEARARVTHLMRPGTVLCMPTTPFPAIRKGLSLVEQANPRDRITCLTAHGGLTGVPQVSLPGAAVDGRPVGLSILGPRGADMTLVALASAFERSP
jgi:amidase